MSETRGKRVRRTSTDRSRDGQPDAYAQLIATGVGQAVAKRLGLPRPVALRRFDLREPLCDEPVLVAAIGTAGEASADGGHLPALLDRLHHLEIEVEGPVEAPTGADQPRLGGIVIDLSGLRAPAALAGFRAIAGPAVKRLQANARVVLIGTDPADLTDPGEVATQQALSGIVRSLGKELRAGATANLVYAPAAGGHAASVANTVEFFLSGRSAYVAGQVLTLGAAEPRSQDRGRPLTGKVALVTGAARGIGAAIVEVLARDGATVVGVDVPGAGESLAQVVNAVHGTALPLDITQADAGQRILEHCRERHGRLDIVIHNAGITRDKLLVNMKPEGWDQVIDVNLRAMLAINEALLAEADGGLSDGGRIICLSSQNGIAGARGQTNYAASKAGVIGLVEATAPLVADRGITINAVAPGFIETEMTARMPLAPREIGRRLNSLQQGGLPVDVAETIAFLAQPGSQAVSGQVLRICGQSLIGA
ncbi:3-oxoacyl-ACP reductase [Granulicoccus sp. GXG6511]|uniref:3-oxoacyl-ACP reductase n=1 Tax=Granulicoccus sp. GXG6511 TaxID=3381351 RepID=UPI003D7CDB52